jgi:hypothetical protein
MRTVDLAPLIGFKQDFYGLKRVCCLFMEVEKLVFLLFVDLIANDRTSDVAVG